MFLEFEILFPEYDDEKLYYKQHISMDIFRSAINRMKDLGLEMIPGTENGKEELDISIYNSDLRMTVEGVDNIQLFCKTNRLTDELCNKRTYKERYSFSDEHKRELDMKGIQYANTRFDSELWKFRANLKKEYIDKGKVKFEHHSFPLDLAALNAEIIVRCHTNIDSKFQLLDEIYKKQSQWAVGSDINIINESIKKIGLDSGLKNSKMNECLKNENLQEEILNERIEAQKKYKIESTPTIFINEKRYSGAINYKQFKKNLEKNL